MQGLSHPRNVNCLTECKIETLHFLHLAGHQNEVKWHRSKR